MKLASTIAALAVVALAASNASAQHFNRQIKEAEARRAAAHHHLGVGAHHRLSHHGVPGHWGGPTTHSRFYYPSHGRGVHQNIQYYGVNPYGYGIPGYGFGAPCYGSLYGGAAVYGHRGFYHGR